jgi:hypothetical protein
MKLKTLKDLPGIKVNRLVLKAEAIKWVKEYLKEIDEIRMDCGLITQLKKEKIPHDKKHQHSFREGLVWGLMKFHNITEEDLK